MDIVIVWPKDLQQRLQIKSYTTFLQITHTIPRCYLSPRKFYYLQKDVDEFLLSRREAY